MRQWSNMHAEAQPASKPKLRVLLVEDNPQDAELTLHELQRGGFEVSGVVAQPEEEFRRHLSADKHDIIVTDYGLPAWNGMEVVNILAKEALDIPVILVTGSL